MAYKAVEAIWENGAIRWISSPPPISKQRLIVLYEEENQSDVALAELFEELASLRTFQEIEDPVEWQREKRREWEKLPNR